MKDGSGIGILGLGKALPANAVSNEEIEKRANIAPGTILAKTGVSTRHIAASEDTASGLSAEAARVALARSNISAEDLGLIIGCTFTPDYVMPALACKIHQLIGARRAHAFDLLANCTAFQMGVSVADDRLVRNPELGYALVVGTAIQSRYVNWQDPDSCMYFGDGVGAAVLGAVPHGYGFLAHEAFTNSSVYEAVRIRGGGSSFPLRPENAAQGLQYYEINGMEVWKQVVQHQPKVIKQALEKVSLSVQDVDLFVFHQANLHLIEYLMGKMKLPMERTITNVQRLGNTAEASMAIALCEASEMGILKRDMIVVLSGVGAGFTFGASVIRWW